MFRDLDPSIRASGSLFMSFYYCILYTELLSCSFAEVVRQTRWTTRLEKDVDAVDDAPASFHLSSEVGSHFYLIYLWPCFYFQAITLCKSINCVCGAASTMDPAGGF